MKTLQAIIILALTALLAILSGCNQPKEEHPNIVFILADDLGYGDLSGLNPDSRPFPGWPVTIRQEDNYGRQAVAWLPELIIKGMDDPVVQVIDESNGEVLYTLRIKGRKYKPKVFQSGSYTVVAGNQRDKVKTLKNLQSFSGKESKQINIQF